MSKGKIILISSNVTDVLKNVLRFSKSETAHFRLKVIGCSCLARCALSIWRRYHFRGEHFKYGFAGDYLFLSF